MSHPVYNIKKFLTFLNIVNQWLGNIVEQITNNIFNLIIVHI